MAKKELTFEQALTRLENIIESIDDDGKALEESIQLYEEGISMAKRCTEKLENASLRVEEVNSGSGSSTS